MLFEYSGLLAELRNGRIPIAALTECECKLVLRFRSDAAKRQDDQRHA